MNNEFYIGWQDKAPGAYAKKIRRVVIALILLAVVVASGLVISERQFNASTFEINRLTTLEGILVIEPVPCLKLPVGTDPHGALQFQRVMLIGFGKKGAQPTLQAIEAAQGQTLEKKGVKIEGKLIYFDGLPAMELSNGVDAFKGFSENLNDAPSLQQNLGEATLRGEILDPKCYLGVMRPGEGKPHRSCAVRCIAGGINPLFKTSTGIANQYFFVLDSQGKSVHHQVAEYVADEIQLCGAVEQWDNWYVVKVDMEEGFRRLNPFWAKGQDIPMCNGK